MGKIEEPICFRNEVYHFVKNLKSYLLMKKCFYTTCTERNFETTNRHISGWISSCFCIIQLSFLSHVTLRKVWCKLQFQSCLVRRLIYNSFSLTDRWKRDCWLFFYQFIFMLDLIVYLRQRNKKFEVRWYCCIELEYQKCLDQQFSEENLSLSLRWSELKTNR